MIALIASLAACNKSTGVDAPPSEAGDPTPAATEPTEADTQEDPVQIDFAARAKERMNMVSEHIEGRGIEQPEVLAAMRSVPRHLFVPPKLHPHAYEDRPLPIGNGQTISQPYIVAHMTELLDLRGGERVLEIGTGSGYQAAVLADVMARLGDGGLPIYSVELVEELGLTARATLAQAGFKVEVAIGDGYAGWPEHAPFDRIIVTAAPPEVPEALLDQLADNGVLVLPVGPDGGFQRIVEIRKTQDGFNRKELTPVRFVPMVRE